MKSGRIMVVDADVLFLDELRFTLAAGGWEVTALTSGMDAVEKALSDRPDVILVELSDGPGGGVRTAEKLKKTPGTAEIPVIYLTEYYSVLSEHPDAKICFKSCLNPRRVVKELMVLLDGF